MRIKGSWGPLFKESTRSFNKKQTLNAIKFAYVNGITLKKIMILFLIKYQTPGFSNIFLHPDYNF